MTRRSCDKGECMRFDLERQNIRLRQAHQLARQYVQKVDGTMAFTVPENRVTYADLAIIDAALTKSKGE